MIDLTRRINAFAELGKRLPDKKALFIQKNTNPWFTAESINYAVDAWANALKKEKIIAWTNKYSALKTIRMPKVIGVVTAGNIPLVCFHDFMSVLIAGHKFQGKLSTKSNKLMPLVIELLLEIEPSFDSYIRIVEDRLKDFDVVIATGSNNTARYFEAYFKDYPYIIRKNRNSVAVLSGKETEKEMEALADDIFLYFGLGCRNVSKLFIPDNFNTNRFFENILHKKDVINHNKYGSNYDYNRSIYLMNKEVFLDNGFAILKEDIGYSSPVSVIYYERYSKLETIKKRLEVDEEKVQCIVSKDNLIEGSEPIGNSQKPGLCDYADNVDTIEFLLNL